MRRVIWAGVVAAVLTGAAVIAWVDALAQPAARPPAAPVATAPTYAPPVVEVDDRVAVDRDEVAGYVQTLVDDPRGWRTDMSRYTLRIVSPGVGGTQGLGGTIGIAYVDKSLALVTADAWTTLGPRFAAVGGTLDDQRTWIVLHELGHLLGHPHQECAGDGPSPVMRAVDYELGDGCTLNVWPNP